MKSILFDPELLELWGTIRDELLNAYIREDDPFSGKADEDVMWLSWNINRLIPGENHLLAAACLGKAAKARGLEKRIFNTISRDTEENHRPQVIKAFVDCAVDKLPEKADEKTLSWEKWYVNKPPPIMALALGRSTWE